MLERKYCWAVNSRFCKYLFTNAVRSPFTVGQKKNKCEKVSAGTGFGPVIEQNVQLASMSLFCVNVPVE